MFVTREALKQVHRVNEILRRISTTHNSVYAVELAQIYAEAHYALCDQERTTTPDLDYRLRLVRTERVHTSEFVKGARQIICEYTINVDGEEGYIASDTNVFTFMAAASMGPCKSNAYLRKGFGSMLLHLLVYCCAAAQLKMNVQCLHSTTVKQYAVYKAFFTEPDSYADIECMSIDTCVSKEWGPGKRESVMFLANNTLHTILRGMGRDRQATFAAPANAYAVRL